MGPLCYLADFVPPRNKQHHNYGDQIDECQTGGQHKKICLDKPVLKQFPNV